MPPGMSNYSRARSLDTITEIVGLEKDSDKRYVWLDHKKRLKGGDSNYYNTNNSYTADKAAQLQRVFEEESRSSSCSDLSAINSDESKGT